MVTSGSSNAILTSDLLSSDGPFGRVADDFVRSRCTQCDQPLTEDPRYGEWGAYCSPCWVAERNV